jgi:hypothetical protein
VTRIITARNIRDSTLKFDKEFLKLKVLVWVGLMQAGIEFPLRQARPRFQTRNISGVTVAPLGIEELDDMTDQRKLSKGGEACTEHECSDRI